MSTATATPTSCAETKSKEPRSSLAGGVSSKLPLLGLDRRNSLSAWPWATSTAMAISIWSAETTRTTSATGGTSVSLGSGGAFDSAAIWPGPSDRTTCVALADIDGDARLDPVERHSHAATLY